MGQLNLNLTPEFEQRLQAYMKKSGIPTKSEAIRRAVQEALERLRPSRAQTNYQDWIGLGLTSAPNPKPLFKDEDDLW